MKKMLCLDKERVYIYNDHYFRRRLVTKVICLSLRIPLKQESLRNEVSIKAKGLPLKRLYKSRERKNKSMDN